MKKPSDATKTDTMHNAPTTLFTVSDTASPDSSSMLPRRSIGHVRSHAWRIVAPSAVNGPECIQVYRGVDVYNSQCKLTFATGRVQRSMTQRQYTHGVIATPALLRPSLHLLIGYITESCRYSSRVVRNRHWFQHDSFGVTGITAHLCTAVRIRPIKTDECHSPWDFADIENTVDEQFRLENCLVENRRILPKVCFPTWLS